MNIQERKEILAINTEEKILAIRISRREKTYNVVFVLNEKNTGVFLRKNT